MHILLADDHPLFAEALRRLIKRSMPASSLTTARDLEGAHRALSSAERFDLIILDLQMPDVEGFDGVERTVTLFPTIPLVVISGAATAANVARAIQLGARGFFPKTMSPNVLAAALQVVAAGGTYVPADYAQAQIRMTESPGLTPREREILTLLVSGQSNKEIARTLDLQEITVKFHVRNIFRKLNVDRKSVV